MKKKAATDLLKWQIERAQGPWQTRELANVTVPPERIENTTRITFINHATLLVQVDGINLLSDPIWSDRTGPYGKIGPSRFRPPGVSLDDLPNIDVVFVSHAHYDHMDLPTLASLRDRFDPVFVVGLGNADNLAKVDITKVVELDWWQTHPISDTLKITATPAAHWSKRTAFDTNRTLWAGYALIRNDEHHVFLRGTAAMPNTLNAFINALAHPPLR